MRRVIAAAGLAAVFAGTVSAAGGSRPAFPLAQPALEGNRAPYDLVFSPDGARVYVTEAAEGTVSVIRRETLRVERRFPTGGVRPAGLAVTPDGSELIVANSYSGNVGLLDARTGQRRASIPCPGMPYGVAVAPDGKRAYVTVSQLDEVAVIDLRAAGIVGRVKVGRQPRALALTPDGGTLAVGNMLGGSVSVVDTATLREQARVRLKGTNVRGIAVTGDGNEAYATLMPPFNGRPTADPKEIWHNLVQAVTLAGATSSVAEDQWMDFARAAGTAELFGSPDQHDIALDPTGSYAWTAVSGRDVVTRITIRDRNRNTIWPRSQIETPVGATPRGLALSPDARQVWVANYLGNSVSVVDAESGSLLNTIDLGKASRVDPTLFGQYLFHSAGMTRAARFTCNSCHPDGASDGLTWRFVHVKDGFQARNTRDLRVGLEGTAPFRWSGLERHLDEFVESEITGLLGGPKPAAEEVRALERAVSALTLPPNPYRGEDGELTPQARVGRDLFTGRAGCSTCHAGPKHGSTGRKAWVGTTPAGQEVDIPHLRGVYDSAPYLHDGRADTLEELFSRHNRRAAHGRAHLLTADELRALLRYVREL